MVQACAQLCSYLTENFCLCQNCCVTSQVILGNDWNHDILL